MPYHGAHKVFLPCELKPHSQHHKLIERKVLRFVPAFMFGLLYEVDEQDFFLLDSVGYVDNRPILFGYMCFMDDGALDVLDAIKGFYGDVELNVNHRRLCCCSLTHERAELCWTYQISDRARPQASRISIVKHGMWDENDHGLNTFASNITS